MTKRSWANGALGVLLALGGLPLTLHAQGTATTGTGTASTGGATGGASGGGTAGTSSTGVSSGINLNSGSGLITTYPIKAFTSTGASATTIPSTSNIFATTYVNPNSLGQPSLFAANLGPLTKTTGTYGKGLYLNAATTTAATTGSTTTTAGTGFDTYPVPRAPSYVTVLGEGLAPKKFKAAAMQADLQAKLSNSKSFKNASAIRVDFANGVATLRGEVASETERIRAEGLAAFTRGVDEVHNELRIVPIKE